MLPFNCDSYRRALRGFVSLLRLAAFVSPVFAQPPALAAGASYRADAAPRVAAPQSFAEALADDPETTDAMRRAWSGQ